MISMSLELLTDSVATPVNIMEVKEHMGIDHNNEDYLIDPYIRAATKIVENITGRALITQSWRQVFFKAKMPLILLKRPVQEIIEIRYSQDGVEQTLEAANYNLLDYKVVAEDIVSDYIVVDYKAGYGDDAQSITYDIKHAIKLLVAYWYENRSDLNKVPDDFKDLLASYKTIAY